MAATKKFLEKYAGTKSLIILFTMTVVFNLLLFPLLMPADDDIKPLDIMFAYSPEDAYEMISALGDAGRQNYIKGLLFLDFIYPVIYSLFLGFSIYLLYREILPAVSPLLILVSDYIENTGIIIMLSSYPTGLITIAWITSFFTSLKWILAGLAVLVIMIGLLRRIRLNLF